MEKSKINVYFAYMNNKEEINQCQSVVAIDPDVDRNGLACLEIASNVLTIQTLPFPQTLEYLSAFKETDKNAVVVLIEAGWLNHTHWHGKWGDSARVIAAKGNSVGRNHEVGRKIAEMCEYWKIPYKLVKPLKKVWKGTDGKITATELERLLVANNIKFSFKHSNQEVRDSVLLAFVWAKRNINGF